MQEAEAEDKGTAAQQRKGDAAENGWRRQIQYLRKGGCQQAAYIGRCVALALQTAAASYERATRELGTAPDGQAASEASKRWVCRNVSRDRAARPRMGRRQRTAG